MQDKRAPAVFPDLEESLSLLEQRFPERTAQAGDGVIAYRSCGSGPAVVLLHGIGSGAASWLHCALQLERHAQLFAWDAPGYGASTALPQAAPNAADYAARLAQWLDALGIARCMLVGHSLGALMASAYASAGSGRIAKLLLLSPAQGYGSPDKQARAQQVEQERLRALESLGVDGMAEHRSGRMLSPQASEGQRQWVRWNMRRLNPAGYTQAVRLLCGDDIRKYRPAGVDGAVHCGSADVVTTPQASRALADDFGLPFGLIDGAGHACYIERPDAVADLVRGAIDQVVSD